MIPTCTNCGQAYVRTASRDAFTVSWRHDGACLIPDDGQRGSGQSAPHATQQGAATPGQCASTATGNVAEQQSTPSGHRSAGPSSPLSWHLLTSTDLDTVSVYARHDSGECVAVLCHDNRGFKVMETLAGVPLDEDDADEVCDDVRVYFRDNDGWRKTRYRLRGADETQTARDVVRQIEKRMREAA